MKTPTPWHLGKSPFTDRVVADGVVVAHCLFGLSSPRTVVALANAAHIVKCVNLHDELVVAPNGALVALQLGEHVDRKAAIDYGLEVLRKVKNE